MVAADRRPLGVTAFFSLLGEWFIAGRLEEMARAWSYPCPVEIDGQLVLMRGPEVFEAYLAEIRSALLARGLTAVTPQIAAIEMPRKGRFRVWLRWVQHYGDHIERERHGTLYFMVRRPDGGLTIEMMDIVHLPSESAARTA